MWQLGGYCLNCGLDLKPTTFNDAQYALPMTFEVPKQSVASRQVDASLALLFLISLTAIFYTMMAAS